MSSAPVVLEDRIVKWAVEEFSFRQSSSGVGATSGRYSQVPVVPNARDLKKICRGNMIPVWNFLLERCHSEEHTKRIKTALILHSKQTEETIEKQEIDDLQQQRDELKAELEAIKANVQRSDLEINELKHEVIQQEKAVASVEAKLRNLEVKRALLDALSQKLEQIINVINEYNRRVKDIVSSFASNKKQEKLKKLKDTKKLDDESLTKTSENIAITGIKETVTSIQSYLISFYAPSINNLQGLTSQLNPIHAEAFEQAIKAKGEALLFGENTIPIGPEDLILGLIANTRISTDALRNETTNTTNESTLTTKPSSDGATKTVKDILELERQQHIQRFIQTKDFENKTREIQQQLAHTIENNSLKDAKDELSRTVYELQEAEIDLACEEATIATYEASLKKLKEEREEKVNSMQILEEKLKQIEEYDKIYKQRLELISSLEKQNQQLCIQVEKKRSENANFIAKKSHQYPKESVSSLSKLLPTIVSSSTEHFQKVDVADIEHLQNPQRLIDELNLMDPKTSPEEVENTVKMLQSLNFPLYKSPDSLLVHVVKLSHQLDELTLAVKNQEQTLTSKLQQSKTIDNKTIDELENQIKWIENIELQQWIPTLRDALDNAQRALQECQTSIPQIISDWKEHPAQYLVKWLSTEGTSLEQYLARSKQKIVK